jgi:4-hydroxy-3-polyprenylbenzoate decarboxylase
MQIVVALTGASGVVYGIRMLEALKKLKVESHLVMSEWAEKNIEIETDLSTEYVRSLASRYYDDNDMAAPISSGSFKVNGMAVIPCSMKTLSGIANAVDDNLITRAAGVCIKESRKLVVVPRETPLSRIHLDNMVKVAQNGVIVLPAMPGFYHRPRTIDDLINHVVGKTLDQFGIEHKLFARWTGGKNLAKKQVIDR